MHLSRTFQTQTKKTITIHCLDCMEGLKNLDNDSTSLVVTSPPYNIGIRYGVYNDKISRTAYLDWMDSWAAEIKRILSPDGSLFLNVGSTPSDPFVAMDVARRVSEHLALQNVFHWIKAISIDARHLKFKTTQQDAINFGHFKPIQSKRYVNDCHEFVFHFTRSGSVEIDRKSIGVPYTDKSNIKRWKSAGEDKRCRGNTWFIPYQTIVSAKKQRPHPASFPEELVEHCIRLHGVNHAKQVLDPFMGIGTSALACAALDVNCVGFEIDPDYFAECVLRIDVRLNSHQKQKPLFGDA